MTRRAGPERVKCSANYKETSKETNAAEGNKAQWKQKNCFVSFLFLVLCLMVFSSVSMHLTLATTEAEIRGFEILQIHINYLQYMSVKLFHL